ncbi:MAG: prepilin peptidase [Patescibacteria group bacterium]|nr:prepilin peptidase [Patescibacteria group bacterium]
MFLTIIGVLVFIFGLVFGSFLNALEWRLFEKKSLMTRSECTKCHKMIKWYDNIPIFSFLFLKGKCRECQAKISWQYPIVELVMGLLFVFVLFYYFSFADFSILSIVRDCLVIFVLSFVFVYDFKYMEVSDTMTLGSSLLFFIIALFLGSSWFSMILGALIGGGFFLLQFVLSKGKWVGGGDIRIGFLMGILLGWKLLLLALWLAYIIGGFISIFLVLSNKKGMKNEVAFGTYLTVATFITMFFGNQILEWYFRLIF